MEGSMERFWKPDQKKTHPKTKTFFSASSVEKMFFSAMFPLLKKGRACTHTHACMHALRFGDRHYIVMALCSYGLHSQSLRFGDKHYIVMALCSYGLHSQSHARAL